MAKNELFDVEIDDIEEAEKIDEMDKEQKKFFDKFKKEEITDAEILEGEEKAENLGDKKNDFLLLIDMVKDSINGSFKIPALTLASIIGSIIYVISPIDAIPDIIPVLGWGDDMTVIGVVMASIAATVADYKKHKGLE